MVMELERTVLLPDGGLACLRVNVLWMEGE